MYEEKSVEEVEKIWNLAIAMKATREEPTISLDVIVEVLKQTLQKEEIEIIIKKLEEI